MEKIPADYGRKIRGSPLPAVLAFGGNALLPDASGPEVQESRAEAFARALKLLLPEEAGMALVHGNGPQVGMILLRIEATRNRIPPETLDILVAETQGSIGYLLCRALRGVIPNREVAAVLTQVVVDRDDPGFARPEKPIGPIYGSDEADILKREHGWMMVEVQKHGWRRVVPSPRPERIVEMHTIADAVSHSHLVIAGGGGGIPVTGSGRLHGVEAVIDKDSTASLLAIALCAGVLAILTDVPHVSTGFGTAEEKPIAIMDVRAARSLLDCGEFPPGSMGPKVEACTDYVSATGKRALITDVDHLEAALDGRDGTWILPGQEGSIVHL
ncbi:MAG TPA: carbamate kinase [Methanotrichaceae archaeon]|nr:carbamate kinase [Methanotrichaceae archaeon]